MFCLWYSLKKVFGWVWSIYLTFMFRDTFRQILLSQALIQSLSNQFIICLTLSPICALLIILMVKLLLIHLTGFFFLVLGLNRRLWPKGGVIWYLSSEQWAQCDYAIKMPNLVREEALTKESHMISLLRHPFRLWVVCVCLEICWIGLSPQFLWC